MALPPALWSDPSTGDGLRLGVTEIWVGNIAGKMEFLHVLPSSKQQL